MVIGHRVPQRGRSVRLDVPLVHRRRPKLALDHQVRRRERGRGVPLLIEETAGDVAGTLADPLAELLGVDILVEDRRVVPHRGQHVQHRRERFVLDADQLRGLLGDVDVVGSDGGDGVTLVEHLLVREHVRAQVHQIDGPLTQFGNAVGRAGEVGMRDDRPDPRQRLGRGCVDPSNPGMRMRTAEHETGEHAGEAGIGPVPRTPRHLVDSVVPDGTGADDLVAACGIGSRGWGHCAHIRTANHRRAQVSPLAASAASVRRGVWRRAVSPHRQRSAGPHPADAGSLTLFAVGKFGPGGIVECPL